MNGHALYIIAVTGWVPIRSKPDSGSELIAVLLYGETAETLAIEGSWVQLLTHNEDYIGWVERSRIRFLRYDTFQEYIDNPDLVRWPYSSIRIFTADKGRALLLPTGAWVRKADDTHFMLEDGTMYPWPSANPMKKETPAETAKSFLGTPYLRGGRTDSGIDAPGLIQLVYQLHDIAFPRSCRQQANVKAFTTDEIQHAEPNSIIYFNIAGGSLNHNGIYLGEGAVIHAWGSVTIENINPQKRLDSEYNFNERLANSVAGIQPPVTVEDFVIPAGEEVLT